MPRGLARPMTRAGWFLFIEIRILNVTLCVLWFGSECCWQGSLLLFRLLGLLPLYLLSSFVVDSEFRNISGSWFLGFLVYFDL